MRADLRSALVALILSSGLAQAEADLPKVRPMPRPQAELAAMHPQPRPQPALIRPMPRPDVSVQTVVLAPKAQKPVSGPTKGAVCQRADIKGKMLPPIVSRNQGCNVADPVLLSEVAGVRLLPPATVNCEEARALSTWIRAGLQPAFGNAIVRLNVVDSYACRPRNNVPGNPVSVHGLGQAIDIAGFVTASGQTYTVASNYNSQIRAAERAGCGTFHTILGPGSDGYHENHIHFDVAHHGGSDYCH